MDLKPSGFQIIVVSAPARTGSRASPSRKYAQSSATRITARRRASSLKNPVLSWEKSTVIAKDGGRSRSWSMTCTGSSSDRRLPSANVTSISSV